MNPLSRLVSALRAARSSGGWLFVLPHLVLGLFVVALFALLVVLKRHEAETARNALKRDFQWAEQTIRTRLYENQDFLQRLAKEIAEGTLEAGAFRAQATRHVSENPELNRVVWIDEDQEVRWVAPFESAAWSSGQRLSTVEEALAYQRAQRTGIPAYSMPVLSAEESDTIELHVPVIQDRAWRGAVVGIYSASDLLRHLVPAWFSEKYRLVLETDDRVLSANSSVVLKTDLTDIVSLDPPGQGLRLRVSAFAAESHVPLDMILLLIAGLVLLMAWSLWALGAHIRRRLRAERERDRLFNLSLDLMCVLHLDGRIVRANPAFERVLGVAPEAMQGTSLLELVHPDDVQATLAEVRKLAGGEPSTGFENRYRTADGSYRWLAWSANPAADDKLLYCVAHDITDRRQSEEAVRGEYAFRKAMEESVTTGMRAVDMEGRITFVNPAFCDMVGWTAEELLGRVPPFPYWPEEDLADLQDITATWMSGRAPRDGFDVRVKRKTGERFHVRMYISPLIDADGRQTGWMASMVDITEQKRARAELEASHERFVAVLEGLDAAVYVADVATDEILFANRVFKSTWGVDAAGRSSAPFTQGHRASPSASQIDPLALRADDLPRELFDGEVPNDRDGRWYHLRERAIRWVDGRVVRMQIATDVTDRRRAEEISLQQQERLQKTSRLITMGEMASSLAHELNQPLSAIANYCMGSVNRLSSGHFRPEEVVAAMEKASGQAERAGKIIRRMRDFVRKSEPKRDSVPLAEVVDEAIGIAEIEAHKAGVRIRVEVPPDLPPVYADKIMIEQVLLNLVKNGIEAMQQTEGSRELTVSARPDGARAVEVAVADRGHGFDPQHAERLFEPFHTTKQEGMGMGLNICRSILEFHDSRLWAQPNPGGGSVFRFTLPIGG
jgi:PAS domain S-box-containing protein